jgi:starch-binding outer membrane protein, SusD/RagB family
MKKIPYIFLMLMFIFSCENILDKQPLDIISDNVVWSDPILIDAYLTQCYGETHFINDTEYASDGWWGPGYDWFPLTNMAIISDESTVGWEGYVDVGGGKSWMFRADNPFMDYWAYPLLRKLNEFIARVPDSPINEDQKKVRLAESRFLRAYLYFQMVKRYGGVPLITEVQAIDTPIEELYVSRDTEEALYEFIISEINAFKNDLPDVKNAGGRPTKYTAEALMSRVSMYAASIATWGQVQMAGLLGIPSNRAQQYWQMSYDASKAIINSGNYQLYNKTPEDKEANFRNIFLDENNVEVIFSEVYDGQAGKGHAWDFLNNPRGLDTWQCCGQTVCAYLEMVEEWESIDGSSGKIDRQKIENGYLWTMDELFGQKDPRFHASIQTQGDSWIGETIQRYKGIIKEDGTITESEYKGIPGIGKSAVTFRPTGTPFGILKYMDESLGVAPFVGGKGASKTDWIVFRYGEILLNFAEAAFELGKPGEALDAVNQIRERAGIAPLTSIDRDKIRHERKVELYGEAHRYWDVRRWRTAETDLSVVNSSLRYILDYTTRKYKLEIIPNIDGAYQQDFLPRNYYFPIGLALTTNNPNLEENPGY